MRFFFLFLCVAQNKNYQFKSSSSSSYAYRALSKMLKEIKSHRSNTHHLLNGWAKKTKKKKKQHLKITHVLRCVLKAWPKLNLKLTKTKKKEWNEKTHRFQSEKKRNENRFHLNVCYIRSLALDAFFPFLFFFIRFFLCPKQKIRMIDDWWWIQCTSFGLWNRKKKSSNEILFNRIHLEKCRTQVHTKKKKKNR